MQEISKQSWALANFTADNNHELQKPMGIANDIISHQIYDEDKINLLRIFYMNEDSRSENGAF